jgi:S-adenosylmethionine synthetase
VAHRFREALTRSFTGGRLERQGPDGKLVVRLRESSDAWVLEHVLVTVQHLDETPIMDVAGWVAADLRDCYRGLQRADRRWTTRWEEVQLLVNPNGPLVNGGSDGDNGQTGRKLAMDFYGPRVPIGGGALSGKDLSHIDRAAAYALRKAAVDAVRGGAGECLVTGVWAPNFGTPLDVIWQMERRGPRKENAWFNHDRIVAWLDPSTVNRDLARGRHFFDQDLIWNGG